MTLRDSTRVRAILRFSDPDGTAFSLLVTSIVPVFALLGPRFGGEMLLAILLSVGGLAFLEIVRGFLVAGSGSWLAVPGTWW